MMFHRPFRNAALAIAAATAVVTSVTLQASAAGQNRAPEHCSRPAVAGDTSVDVEFGGVTYPVLVYVPEDLHRNRVPLVLNLHGSTANAQIQMDVSGLR